jgi:hypothetical protein
MKYQIICVIVFLLPFSGVAQNINQAVNKYNFAGHADFKIFWTDFKNAVNTGDKDAVAKMTSFPFKDSRDLGQGVGIGPNNLTCKNASEFISSYGRIFLPTVIKDINTRKYFQSQEYDGDPDNDHQKLIPNSYTVFAAEMGEFIFKKINGKYKLTDIPYME